MKKKVSYNIQVAINLRGGEPVDYDFMGNPIFATDFKSSIKFAGDKGFLFGYFYPGEPIMTALTSGRQMTREEWKKESRAYRLYVRNSNS